MIALARYDRLDTLKSQVVAGFQDGSPRGAGQNNIATSDAEPPLDARRSEAELRW